MEKQGNLKIFLYFIIITTKLVDTLSNIDELIY